MKADMADHDRAAPGRIRPQQDGPQQPGLEGWVELELGQADGHKLHLRQPFAIGHCPQEPFGAQPVAQHAGNQKGRAHGYQCQPLAFDRPRCAWDWRLIALAQRFPRTHLVS
jgi:hypothetical protein